MIDVFNISDEELTKTMTELILNLLDENIDLREEAAKAMEIVLKEAGGYPDQIRQLLQVTIQHCKFIHFVIWE